MNLVDEYCSAFSEFGFHPFDNAILADGNLVVTREMSATGVRYLCGYVAIPKENIPQALWGAIESGSRKGLKLCDLANNLYSGLTHYSTEEQEGKQYAVFGFDFRHGHDELDLRTRTPQHALETARQMEQQILLNAQRYEPEKVGFLVDVEMYKPKKAS